MSLSIIGTQNKKPLRLKRRIPTLTLREKILKRIAEGLGLLPSIVLADSNEIEVSEKLAFRKFSSKRASVATGMLLRLNSGGSYRSQFFVNVYRTVMRYPELFEEVPRRIVCWSERHVDETENDFLVAEHGWLPRHFYQISNRGVNSQSHVKYEPGTDYYSIIGKETYNFSTFYSKSCIGLKREKSSIKNKYNEEKFVLVPLQGAKDYNLKYSNSIFSHLYGSSNRDFAQSIVNHLADDFKSIKYVLTEHPSCPVVGKLSLPENILFCSSKTGLSSIDLATDENCVGVASVNSNVIHEAMLYSVPVCTWGDLLHRRGEGPFYNDINDLLSATNRAESIEKYTSECRQYLSLLFMNQWTTIDLQNPFFLRELFVNPRTTPHLLRKRFEMPAAI